MHIKPPCLFPDCGRTATSKGLCGSHYVAAKLLVYAKLTTWEKLEQQGRARPKVRQHVRSSAVDNWFLLGIKPPKARA